MKSTRDMSWKICSLPYASLFLRVKSLPNNTQIIMLMFLEMVSKRGGGSSVLTWDPAPISCLCLTTCEITPSPQGTRGLNLGPHSL